MNRVRRRELVILALAVATTAAASCHRVLATIDRFEIVCIYFMRALHVVAVAIALLFSRQRVQTGDSTNMYVLAPLFNRIEHTYYLSTPGHTYN